MISVEDCNSIGYKLYNSHFNMHYTYNVVGYPDWWPTNAILNNAPTLRQIQERDL